MALLQGLSAYFEGLDAPTSHEGAVRDYVRAALAEADAGEGG